MNHNLIRTAQRLFNTPLAILPEQTAFIYKLLNERFGVESFTDGNVTRIHLKHAAETMEDTGYSNADNDRDAGYEIMQGMAIIPIEGTLVKRLGSLRPWCGMTGYDGIRQNFVSAINDKKARGIILDIDSPGGEVAGLFDLCDMIYDARVRNYKPVVAILNESAYSAAYAIASAAHRIVLPRTGGAGSIGVIAMHAEYSKALKKEGVAVTIVRHGAQKATVNGVEPLTSEAHKTVQDDVDAMGEMFLELVARNRNIPLKSVRDMEARCFIAKDAVDNCLADAIMSPDMEFANLVDTIT
jgi:signal peptide peptidase SppA